MNTLEVRPYEFVLWRGESPHQVRDRLYPGINLSQRTMAQRSVNPMASYCVGWGLDGSGIMFVELV